MLSEDQLKKLPLRSTLAIAARALERLLDLPDMPEGEHVQVSARVLSFVHLVVERDALTNRDDDLLFGQAERAVRNAKDDVAKAVAEAALSLHSASLKAAPMHRASGPPLKQGAIWVVQKAKEAIDHALHFLKTDSG